MYFQISPALSAIVAGYEAIQRLVHPRPVEHLGWVALAGLLGFIGNEWVALYRIRIGRRIGSAALVADGLHIRADVVTSVGVLVGVGLVAVTGHLLRGGSPTSFDRLAAMRFGTAAVRALGEGQSGIMVALGFPNVNYVPLEEVAGRMKAVPLDSDTVQTARDLGIEFGD